jgi:hypothetical protein
MVTQFSINDNKPWKAAFFTIWYLTVLTGSATVLATAALVNIKSARPTLLPAGLGEPTPKPIPG